MKVPGEIPNVLVERKCGIKSVLYYRKSSFECVITLRKDQVTSMTKRGLVKVNVRNSPKKTQSSHVSTNPMTSKSSFRICPTAKSPRKKTIFPLIEFNKTFLVGDNWWVNQSLHSFQQQPHIDKWERGLLLHASAGGATLEKKITEFSFMVNRLLPGLHIVQHRGHLSRFDWSLQRGSRGDPPRHYLSPLYYTLDCNSSAAHWLTVGVRRSRKM